MGMKILLSTLIVFAFVPVAQAQYNGENAIDAYHREVKEIDARHRQYEQERKSYLDQKDEPYFYDTKASKDDAYETFKTPKAKNQLDITGSSKAQTKSSASVLQDMFKSAD